jgi:hypothetical protein
MSGTLEGGGDVVLNALRDRVSSGVGSGVGIVAGDGYAVGSGVVSGL